MNWNELAVSPQNTHHVAPSGHAAYQARFDQVLKFHAPGLAPAQDASGAFHIDPAGVPAYETRFERTFGFYQGRAAVQAADGWRHIHPDGADLSSHRFQWCGNYQDGRCTVRETSMQYRHLHLDGTNAYETTWRYAGDYRGGVAVVQRDDGLHTHIDPDGNLLHGSWFIDLDVFHKGFARGKDVAGWTHVDTSGKPLYERRFAMVEPFYNGQARVERFDGGLEVIDETGLRCTELRPARHSEFASLSSDLVGYWRTDAIAIAVELGVFEALPNTTVNLAHALGLDAQRFGALMRGLRELNLVRRDGQMWSLTSRGALLQQDHPLTLADAALEYAGPLREVWANLPAALRDSSWSTPDIFARIAGQPDRIASHHRMLRSYARHDYPAVAAALPLQGNERLVDVAGGTGALAKLLVEHHLQITVTVLERPEVAVLVPEHPRIEALAGDLFQQWSIDVNVAVLARVLHDWDDDEVLRILRNVVASSGRGTRVFVVEMLPSDDGAFGGLCDLHLLASTGGRERTAGEYRSLLEAADIEFVGLTPLAGLSTILEGVVR